MERLPSEVLLHIFAHLAYKDEEPACFHRVPAPDRFRNTEDICNVRLVSRLWRKLSWSFFFINPLFLLNAQNMRRLENLSNNEITRDHFYSISVQHDFTPCCIQEESPSALYGGTRAILINARSMFEDLGKVLQKFKHLHSIEFNFLYGQIFPHKGMTCIPISDMLSNAHWPYLTRLDLDSCLFKKDILESFLERHSSSLRFLAFSFCTLDSGDDYAWMELCMFLKFKLYLSAIQLRGELFDTGDDQLVFFGTDVIPYLRTDTGKWEGGVDIPLDRVVNYLVCGSKDSYYGNVDDVSIAACDWTRFDWEAFKIAYYGPHKKVPKG